ncbi:adenylate kinase [Candidatus Woesearchaeota archaeon]|jgi:adenylate kinase|nr:adenylate kinase [Candidatus Woesearchaeota archaeon]MBT3537023.1 adenylate kinase [Candidatus Woesearchaeota archaeon]MBT4697633.1 adenylate kinase [Candidatus Woesearchaeota archaeon]MBT4716894.1 adenylate kinase [Candidatus Woesearchaeota archaeon]MBT7106667.1 adenylate kinase [Candidatus Woesearchaeota archaeon]
MKLIFLGQPGAGKGTIAEMVVEKYGVAHISTGDILREAIKNETEMGQKAKDFMDKGELVPDEVVIGIVEDRLKEPDCEKGFLFDGFPRTIPQAEALDKITEISKVIELTCSEETVLDRLATRWTCKECSAIFNVKTKPPKEEGKCDSCGGVLYQREDQKPETVKERLVEYKNKTAPLTDYYDQKGLLSRVGTESTPQEIFSEVVSILDA